ncbi:MAG: helix-turn-helix transcriptional regulator [Eubacteriales bacterium]|nr:helix-turn-helix transcriptional regulator [Eubacteriales bacterium]
MELKTKDVIVKLRKSKGWSQEELANRVQVSRQTVSAWERGLSSIDVDSMILLCHEFGLTVEEFLKQAAGEETLEENSSKDMQIVDKLTEIIAKQRTEQQQIEKDIVSKAKTLALKYIAIIFAVVVAVAIIASIITSLVYEQPIGTFVGLDEYDMTVLLICVLVVAGVDLIANAIYLVYKKVKKTDKGDNAQ